jgi:hypothetical protein
MAGALDTAFKAIAKSVVADLGTALDTSITYTRKASPSYDYATGALTTTDTSYSSIKVPVEFVVSEEEEGREERQAKIYITPDLIGSNQPTFEDQVTLTYAGASRTAQITDIRTYRGGQEYLYILLVRF